MLVPYEAIKDSTKNHPGFMREQHCMTCRNVLAIELTDKFGSLYAGEWYVVKQCIVLANEPHLYYEKKRWYGNRVKCPVCGREGRLPIDKPYNWELIQKSKEERNANRN